MSGPTLDFWREKFQAGDTPWDRGEVNPQLMRWVEAGTLAPCRVLVPGCGSGHEVAYLAARGFDVTAIDYAPEAVRLAQARLAQQGLPARIETADALQWQPAAAFDAVYEQTCLCALHPDQWQRYATQLHGWIRPEGRLFALFMQAPRPGGADGFVEGPPYHCDMNAMRALFREPAWTWPKPPYPRSDHPRGIYELGVVLPRSA
ncbi:MAG: methyltransferase domain-containing protein [Betaproteobacteria bacterium]|nr:methyltransferase domain-containing protein [Betaproteobacteria bacterium]